MFVAGRKYPPGLLGICIGNQGRGRRKSAIQLYFIGKHHPETLAVTAVKKGVKTGLGAEVLTVVYGFKTHPSYLAGRYADEQKALFRPFLNVLFGEHSGTIMATPVAVQPVQNRPVALSSVSALGESREMCLTVFR